MRSILTEHLVRYATTSIGAAASQDMVYLWLEELVATLLEQPWPWNWKQWKGQVLPSVAEVTTTTFTWVAGNTFVTSNVALSALTYTRTGRKVLISDEWYMAVDVGFTSTTRIYLDRPLVTTVTTGTALTFYRDEYALPTSRIRDVQTTESLKLIRYSEDWETGQYLGFRTEKLQPSSPPSGYIDRNGLTITPPRYPPKVVVGVGAGPNIGTYNYFYTRYDAESGLESQPGPVLKWTQASAVPLTVTYDNPTVADRSEDTSYPLRLYRSRINPPRDRVPMFRLAERSPFAQAPAYVDSLVDNNLLTVRHLPYWDGPWAVVQLLPVPDTRESMWAWHLKNWTGRLDDLEYLPFGQDNMMADQLRLYLGGALMRMASNPKEHRDAIIAFKAQLAYLVTRSRPAGDDDVGPENYNPITPMTDHAQELIDSLRWKDT